MLRIFRLRLLRDLNLSIHCKMSLEVIEDNCLFICSHCEADLGRIDEILKEDIASKHLCFRNCSNVEIDFETKQIFRSLPQKECSPEPTSSDNMILNDDASTSAEENHPATTMEGETRCTWTHEAIKLLIFSFVQHKDKFQSVTYTKKNVWKIISDDLKKKGIIRDPSKCDEKWRNLKKTYDKIRSEKNKTGNHSVHWKYYKEFQEIYFHDPYFEPVASVSSTGLRKTSANNEIPSENQVNTPGHSRNLSPARSRNVSPAHSRNVSPARSRNLSPGEISRKRTLSSYEIEQKRQKRHEQKMDLKREMFEWMKEHFGKK